MQAEPIHTIPAESSDKSPQPTEPVDALQEPVQEPEAAARADDAPADAASAETEATPEPPASPARGRRWFKRRRSKGPAADAPEAAEPSADAPTTDAADAPTTDAADAAVAAEPAAEAPDAPDAPEPAAEAPEAQGEPQTADGQGEPTDGDDVPSVEAAEHLPQAERKPVTKAVVIAVAAAAAIFVGAAAFAGAMLQPYLVDRALVDTKLDVARTAANAITTLWTYTPQDMDKLPQRSAKYLAGDFADAYRKYVDGIAAANKQAQVSNSTQVMGAAVETLDGPNASAVVYTNTTYTSPVTKNVPSLQYLSYRLTMERKDSRWLITHMTTITSVDLTPKFG